MIPVTEGTRSVLLEGDSQTIAFGLSEIFVELQVSARRSDSDSRRNVKVWATTRTFGDLELLQTHVLHGYFSVIRSEALIDASSSNEFFIVCILNGAVTLTQESRTIAMSSSDLAILDSTRPYLIDVKNELDALWIRVPRHRIEGRLPASVDILAQRVDGSTRTGHLASSLIRSSLSQAEKLTESESLRAGNAILDLVSLSLDVTQTKGESRQRQILRRIQNHIDLNISNPNLCRGSIARRHGISPRYLSKLFEKEGLSVARWIRLRRLELSRQRIESHHANTTSISEIAFSCGFTDVSSFNRAFKKQFGATPGSLRRGQRSAY
ncbi:MAG: helix-turn-helix domain-containing protein [Luminiphilus sp.]|nr:helix-turn-helix domain-containing protein [Luminiphilus sp.]